MSKTSIAVDRLFKIVNISNNYTNNNTQRKSHQKGKLVYCKNGYLLFQRTPPPFRHYNHYVTFKEWLDPPVLIIQNAIMHCTKFQVYAKWHAGELICDMQTVWQIISKPVMSNYPSKGYIWKREKN
jgi:hypothetical protein